MPRRFYPEDWRSSTLEILDTYIYIKLHGFTLEGTVEFYTKT